MSSSVNEMRARIEAAQKQAAEAAKQGGAANAKSKVETAKQAITAPRVETAEDQRKRLTTKHESVMRLEESGVVSAILREQMATYAATTSVEVTLPSGSKAVISKLTTEEEKQYQVKTSEGYYKVVIAGSDPMFADKELIQSLWSVNVDQLFKTGAKSTTVTWSSENSVDALMRAYDERDARLKTPADRTHKARREMMERGEVARKARGKEQVCVEGDSDSDDESAASVSASKPAASSSSGAAAATTAPSSGNNGLKSTGQKLW